MAAALGGAVNAVAGGGSLITFPTLVWLGVAPVTANATNTVALWPGAVGSMWGYRRELVQTDRHLYLLVAPSFAGGLLGAFILNLTPAPLFERLVPWLVFFATCLFMAQEPLQRRFGRPHHGVRSRQWLWAAAVFQFLVGVYGGYFGAGIGILMLAALGMLGSDDIHQMNGFKNLLALCVNGIAAMYFVWLRMVSWPDALVMATGAVVGGVLGAGLARKMGRTAVRRAVVVIGLSMTLGLALRL